MRRLYAAIIIAVLFALLGCGIDNTMYNAKKYFESAQVRPLGANGRPAPQAVSDYTKTIKKCGIILSDGGKGKRADDALFLMARALYYKGNSAFQAKDAFESLIAGFPKSKHVPDSYIYLGRVLREVNQDAESEALLERFVRDQKFVKDHPRALLVMADYEILDEDYHRAQYWLERIIKDYPKTPEFKEAAFLFGKNYYMQGEYEHSLQEFEGFLKTRRVPKLKKLEARYFIALNRLELGDYARALKEVKSLVRNEERPDMLARARVLYGRALLAAGEVNSGLDELKAVTTSYPRTENAANAYYYWGNYLYYHQGIIDEAAQHLNRVRTEFAKSPLAEKGTKLATAINKTKPMPNLNSSRDLQVWLDYNYLRAENFISPLALPDSALVTYQKVINERDTLAAMQDSLLFKIDTASSQIDSLIAVLPAPVEPDSLDLIAHAEASDSLKTDLGEILPAKPAEPGSELALDDNIDANEEELLDKPLDEEELKPDETLETEEPKPEPDLAEISDTDDEELPNKSLEIESEPPEKPLDEEEIKLDVNLEKEEPKPEPAPEDIIDTDEKELPDQPEEPLDGEKADPDEASEEAEPDPIESGQALLRELQRDLPAWQQKADELQLVLERFDTQIIPFCYFSMNSLMLKLPERAEEAEILYEKMLVEYPRNMYSAAATAIKEGRTPRLVDPAYNEALADFDAALDIYTGNPDSLVALMQDYTESEYNDLRLRANYRLGWHYSFEEPDTTLAKEYLSYVLDDPDNADYAPTVRRFFDGEIYLLRDSGLIDSTQVKKDSLATDHAAEEPAEDLPDVFAGPQDFDEAAADSLSFEIDLPQEPLELTEPVLPDSLQNIQADSETEPEEDPIAPEIKPEDDDAEPPTPDKTEIAEPEAPPEGEAEPEIKPEEEAAEPEIAPYTAEEAPSAPQDDPPNDTTPQDPEG